MTQWDADRGLGLQRSPPRAGHDFLVELPLALVLLSLGLWENYIDGEFRWGFMLSCLEDNPHLFNHFFSRSVIYSEIFMQFSSVQGVTCAFGISHIRPTPFLRGLPSVASETVPALGDSGLFSYFKDDRRAVPLFFFIYLKCFESLSVCVCNDAIFF